MHVAWAVICNISRGVWSGKYIYYPSSDRAWPNALRRYDNQVSLLIDHPDIAVAASSVLYLFRQGKSLRRPLDSQRRPAFKLKLLPTD